MDIAKRKDKAMIALARFDSPASLVGAARKLRDAGYQKFDCHSPFPIHGMNGAMGVKRSSLGFMVGAAAAFGIAGAYLMQYWMSAVDYRLVVSGKPFNSFQAFLPVTFSLTVLLSAFTAFIGMLALNRLLVFHNPLFESEKFRSLTDNGFFASVDGADPQFDPDRTRALLESAGGQNFEIIED